MINIEYRTENKDFEVFYNYISNKKVAIVGDINTKPYLLEIKEKIEKYAKELKCLIFEDKQLVPDERAINETNILCQGMDYLLAVGSGTLNDLAKYVATINNIESGILATAPSMDGYASKGSALMINLEKVTLNVNMPHDFLIDLKILCDAPKDMIASGFGDIVGKYTCLTDWKLSHIINGEEINKKSYEMMEEALSNVINSFESISSYQNEGIKYLMDALVIAGLSMANCGNSRPASGSEHHQSHFLEMYFVKNQRLIPLHGIKVALGCLISLELYKHLLVTKKEFEHKEEIIRLVNELPSVEYIKAMLIKIGCPTRFSSLDISKEVFIDMLYNAYKVRDRYSILTFYAKYDLYDEMVDYLVENYY